MKKTLKKVISLLLSVIISLCVFTICASADSILRSGDIDGDGSITAADARLALRISSRIEDCDPMMEKFADADGDDKVTAADARLILRVAANLEEESVLALFEADQMIGSVPDIPVYTRYDKSIIMYEGELAAIDLSEIATPDNFLWKSSNSAVASIDDQGIITAHKKGYASIKVYYEDTVYSWDIRIGDDSQHIYTENDYSITMFEGENAIIDLGTIDTADNFLWKSSDDSVASVDDQGVVTAHKKGYACIMAYYEDNIYSWDLRVRNELQKKIYALQDKYPGGYYWNNQPPSAQYPDVSEFPCTDHFEPYPNDHKLCKGQCAGFAAMIFQEVHGVSIYSNKAKSGITWDNVKIGDYMRLTGRTNHSILILDIIEKGEPVHYNPYSKEYYYAEQKQFYVVHCNWGANCDIIWDDQTFDETWEIYPAYCYTVA